MDEPLVDETDGAGNVSASGKADAEMVTPDRVELYGPLGPVPEAHCDDQALMPEAPADQGNRMVDSDATGAGSVHESRDEADEGLSMPARLEQALAEGLADLKQAFESRLALDRHKDAQIDRLHAELQEYKADLLGRLVRPIIMGIIRLHDDLGKQIEALGRKQPEELSPELFFRAFDGFADDIELLLGQHGVESFELPGEGFDPLRQTASRTHQAEDESLVGTIIERIRPGFSSGETILQKERVSVLAAAPRATRSGPAAPGPGND